MNGPDLMATIAAAANVREYEAARLAADVLCNTALASPAAIWRRLRPGIAYVLRDVAAQARVDALGPTDEPETLREFAADLVAAATLLEHEHVRADFDRAKRLVRERPSLREHYIDMMRIEWKVYRGII